MKRKIASKSEAFTVRLPVRCVEIIDELIDAGLYSSRGECIRDIIRSALREGFHKKMLPGTSQYLRYEPPVKKRNFSEDICEI